MGCQQQVKVSAPSLSLQTTSLSQSWEDFLVYLRDKEEEEEIPGLPEDIQHFYQALRLQEALQGNEPPEVLEDAEGEPLVFVQQVARGADHFELMAYVDHYVLKKNGAIIFEKERNFINKEQFKHLVIDEAGGWWLLYQDNYYYSEEELAELAKQGHNGQPRKEQNLLFYNGGLVPYAEVFGLYQL